MTLQKILVPIAAMIVFGLLWELLVWANGWPNYVMASPSDLPPAYAKYWNLFLVMGWQTLWRTVVGLVVAIIFGVLVGMVMGVSRVMRANPMTIPTRTPKLMATPSPTTARHSAGHPITTHRSQSFA